MCINVDIHICTHIYMFFNVYMQSPMTHISHDTTSKNKENTRSIAAFSVAVTSSIGLSI